MCQEQGLKRTIQTWARIGWGACLAAVLAACGGGASSGGTEEATVSVRVEGLTAGALTLVDDRGHTAVLSANGVQTFARMAAGTTFTPSIASQPSNQVCALDAGARTAASGLELRVRCEAGLLTTSGLRSFAVDQLVMMDTLEAGSAGSVTLGGVAVTPLNNTTGGFTFRVPELTVGAHELRAVVNGRAFSTVLDITANPLTGDAGAFLRNAAASAQSGITDLLNDPAVAAADKTILRQLQTELSEINVDATVDAATNEQLQSLARFAAANDPVALQAALNALLPPVDEQASAQRATLRRVTAAATVDQSRCMRASARFVSAVVVAGASVTAIVATSTEPLGRLLALYGYVQAVVWVKDQLEIMQEVCGGYVGMLVGSTAVEAADSTASAARAQSLASGSVAAQSVARLRAQAVTGLAFNDGEPALLDVVLQKSLSAEVSDRVLVAVARVVSAHRALAATLSGVLTLPGADLINALAALKRDSTELARTLQLEAMTAGFSGSIDPVLDGQGQPTGRFAAVFTSSVAPTSDAPIPFSFRLRDTTADYLGPVISATLQVPLTPVAADLAFETNSGTALSARLTATHATSFTLVTQPSDGTLTLTDPVSGAFTYTPSSGYSGTVGFTYRALNASATSQTATVVIAVLSDEVRCTLTDNSGSPAGTVSLNRTCYRALLTGAETDDELWFRYVPDALGDLQFTGQPEGYRSLMEHVYVPVGLSARVSTEGVSYDVSNNTFTFDKAYGFYNTADGTAAAPSFTYSAQDDDLRHQTQRLRASLVRHPLSGLLVAKTLQRALVQRSYFADQVVRVDRVDHASLTLQSFSAGVPTYATTITRCSRPTSLQSGGYALTSGAEWTVERLTFVNKTETSHTFTTEVVCPLSATTLLNGVGPEKGLNDLSFDWRNPPMSSGG
jgi:hypothetical protein